MASRKITIYFDVLSPYSWLGFVKLQSQKKRWGSKGIKIEFTPFFLAGIMAKSKNKPPGENPMKAKYMAKDLERGHQMYKTSKPFSPPVEFPTSSLLAQRFLTAMKINNDSRMEDAAILLWERYWGGGKGAFRREDIITAMSGLMKEDEIFRFLAACDAENIKSALESATDIAFKSGAFGAPWFIAENGLGETGVFFGSDRMDEVAWFLERPARL